MIKREVIVNGKKIEIEQDLTFGHAGSVWDGALVLINYLNHNKQKYAAILKDKSVVELGAGTGIVGLAAGCFHTSKIVLTDFKENLIMAERNIQLNYPGDPHVVAEELSWGDMESMRNILDKYKPDILIGSQLAYCQDNIKLLLQTIQFYQKANPELMVIISYQKYQKASVNLQEQLKQKQFNYYHVLWNQMDPDFRDFSIGILCIEQKK